MTGEFATSLREHRRRRGMTQDQLAGLSTISVRAIRDLETGRAGQPRQATVRLLADGLGLRGAARDAFVAASRDPAPECGPPLPMTALLGRQVELRAVTGLLLDGHRLVTITGLAGVGKTRLAIEAAHGLSAAGFTVRWNTTRWVPDEPALVVLDGVDEVAPEVPGLLRTHPGLRVLITSVAPLSEHVVAVTPLDAATSARLLVQRIRALDPGFRLDRHTTAAAAEVCRSCDGHPGALELAATWCALWSLDDVVGLLGTHQAGLPRSPYADLTAVVGRSVVALGFAERRVLTWLAGLSGAWTVAEASAATRSDQDVLGHAVHTLLRAGLLRRTGSARFEVLDLVRCLRAEPSSVPA